MSNIYKPVNAGNLPPVVPTSFVSDSGIAIPAANILNVIGGTGINTTGAGNTLTIKLANSGVAFTTTVGAVTSQATIINLGAIPSVGLFVSKVVGFDAGGSGNSCAYYIIRAAKTDGATASTVGEESLSEFEDTAFIPADARATVSGNNVTITVTGVAGFTIDWTIETTFTAS
jgi:hypothetical protein